MLEKLPIQRERDCARAMRSDFSRLRFTDDIFAELTRPTHIERASAPYLNSREGNERIYFANKSPADVVAEHATIERTRTRRVIRTLRRLAYFNHYRDAYRGMLISPRG